MNKRILRLPAILASMVLATLGMSNPASAGTADYQYTCQAVGQMAWAMPSGTPWSDCANGIVYERLNGQLKRTIQINGNGVAYDPNPVSIYCVVSILSTGLAVVSLGSGSIVKVAAEIVLGSVGVYGSCRA